MRQLILFLSKYRDTLLLIVLLALSFFRHSHKNPVSEHWINKVGFTAVAGIQSTLNSWKSYWNLGAVNEELARENAALRASLGSSSLPDFQINTEYQFIPAKVVEYSYTKRNNYMLLNVGKADGIQAGMGVISAFGWVGSVVETSEHHSSVIPIIHGKGNIGARISNKGLGELHWQGTDHRVVTLSDIQREHQPTPGDTVFSFTRSSVGPPVIAGFVSRASQNAEDLTWIADVDLSNDFANMSWVYVCRLKELESLNSLNQSSE